MTWRVASAKQPMLHPRNVLGYYLDTHNDKPGWRLLKVKVDKPGVEMRSQRLFCH